MLSVVEHVDGFRYELLETLSASDNTASFRKKESGGIARPTAMEAWTAGVAAVRRSQAREQDGLGAVAQEIALLRR